MSNPSTFHVGYNMFATLICILVFILQIFAASNHWQRYPWNRDTTLVLCLIFIIFFTNLCCCIFGLLLTFAIPNCDICNWTGIAIQILYATSKLATYLFYLQRAKLAQAFRPKISIYCFNKVFPIIYIIIYFVFGLIAVTRTRFMLTDCRCKSSET